MKQAGLIVLLTSVMGWWLWPDSEELEAREFADRLTAAETAVLIDLRTETEFAAAHIPGALNVTWGSPTFRWRIGELDTAVPLFVYCSTGAGSAKALEYINAGGFSSVTLLRGGFTAWQKEKLRETPPELVPPAELTEQRFNRFLDLEHLVVVYFYLPADKNCRKMGQALDELAIGCGGNVRILRIDIDKYKYLATETGIDEVPLLKFYENGNLIGVLEGTADRDAIEKRFKLHEYFDADPVAGKTLSAR